MGTQGHRQPLTSIVAVDRNGAIGLHNSLPWKLKSDMAFFKQTTLHNTVIMGRKTFESIGGCLPNRMNIVLSHNFDLFPSTDRCRIANSIEESLYRAECDGTEEIFVVGGAMTYQQFAPLIDRYLLTVVDHEVSNADSFLSQSILRDLETWERNELGSYPAVAGQDEFRFSVFEVIAEDIEARRERRMEMFREYSEHIRRKPRSSPNRSTTHRGDQQLSLI